ncbi:hypothetical protein EV421DRAFT_1901468 [Armillaria borealis]|uniref:Uncharacterized protein n=1 Tax=Armillaria borealis TaxID=47425 RepID=A0AA39MUT2_9AGAR|nr:hypothetical protein EV421DRAFT_1901468 [Armillaria borealis]
MSELGVRALMHLCYRWNIVGGASPGMEDQCTIGPDGKLRDASQIQWYQDADDKTPVASPSSDLCHTSLEAQKLNEDGTSKPSQGKGKVVDVSTDDSGSDYSTSEASSQSQSGSEVSTDVEIPNEELANMLPSKTVPSTSTPKDSKKWKQHNIKRRRASGMPPAKRTKCTNANVPDEGLTVPTGEVLSGTSASTLKPTTGKYKKRNPIYLFYESVDVDANGSSGSPGDQHYKCYHGNHKVLTIMKAMRSSLNGLIGHLKHFPVMYRLYEVLHQHPEPPTSEEEDIASGKHVLKKDVSREYLSQLEKVSENIVKALEKQAAKAVGDWDQAKFKCLLLEWIIACD